MREINKKIKWERCQFSVILKLVRACLRKGRGIRLLSFRHSRPFGVGLAAGTVSRKFVVDTRDPQVVWRRGRRMGPACGGWDRGWHPDRRVKLGTSRLWSGYCLLMLSSIFIFQPACGRIVLSVCSVGVPVDGANSVINDKIQKETNLWMEADIDRQYLKKNIVYNTSLSHAVCGSGCSFIINKFNISAAFPEPWSGSCSWLNIQNMNT